MKWTYVKLDVPIEDLENELDNKGKYEWELVTLIPMQKQLPTIMGQNGMALPRFEYRMLLIFKKPIPE